MHSIRQGISLWAVKQKQQHSMLSLTDLTTPVPSHVPQISSCLSPLCSLGWADEENPATHFGPSLRTASTSQWLPWLLTLAAGEEHANLPFHRRHSTLKGSSILFYHLTFYFIFQCWSYTSLFLFCELSWRHLFCNLVYCLLPIAL